MKDDRVYLKHIMDAIGRIEDYTKAVEHEDFMKSNLLQAGVVRELEIIGEASKRLSIAFRNECSDIPWRKMTGMRDKLIHDYFGVDMDAVWDTVKKDIPALKKRLSSIG